ncbi:MAG: hypothetical protein ACXWO1_12415 [Isosphaeraceae bacterium]
MSAEGSPIPNGTDPASVPATSPHELTRWQKFRLVVKVVELRLRFIALMAATGLVFAYWYKFFSASATPHSGSGHHDH